MVLFSGKIGAVNPKKNLFYYLINYFLDQSIQSCLHNFEIRSTGQDQSVPKTLTCYFENRMTEAHLSFLRSQSAYFSWSEGASAGQRFTVMNAFAHAADWMCKLMRAGQSSSLRRTSFANSGSLCLSKAVATMRSAFSSRLLHH